MGGSRGVNSIPDDELFHMRQILRDREATPGGFELWVEQDPASSAGPHGRINQPMVAVRRTSTKKIAHFRHDIRRQTWLIAFERDLVAGYFRKPRGSPGRLWGGWNMGQEEQGNPSEAILLERDALRVRLPCDATAAATRDELTEVVEKVYAGMSICYREWAEVERRLPPFPAGRLHDDAGATADLTGEPSSAPRESCRKTRRSIDAPVHHPNG
jgi:hypothetical protein